MICISKLSKKRPRPIIQRWDHENIPTGFLIVLKYVQYSKNQQIFKSKIFVSKLRAFT